MLKRLGSPSLFKLIAALCLVWVGSHGLGELTSYTANHHGSGFSAFVWADSANAGISRDEAVHRGSTARRKFISDVTGLLEKHFVEPVAGREVLETALDKLTLTLIPLCTKSLEPSKDCLGDPEECFVTAIASIAGTCGLDPDRLCERALRGVLRELDPNASLLDPTMLKELSISVSGRFGGVGMVVAEKNGDYVVIAPFDGSPARAAGIRTGDTILEIDGHPLHGLPLSDVLSMVRGPAGSTVRFTVKDSETGRIEHVRVKRRTIRIAPVRQVMLGRGIGYVRIVNFQRGTAAQVKKALSRMFGHRRTELKGLILDLRDNPGGLLDEAIMVASLFAPSGIITSVRGRDAGSERKVMADSANAFPQIPMVVLINRGSASGSEVLAGAVQGRPNVLVLGERSFGKASVQGVFPLAGGFALRLTTAHYYTSDGRNINGKGLEPDVTMASPEVMPQEKLGFSKREELQQDPAIQRALSRLESGTPLARSPFPTWF